MWHVSVYNLSVKIQSDSQKFLNFVDSFIDKFYSIKTQGYGVQMSTSNPQKDRRFCSKIQNSYYLHINQFKHFIHFARESNFILDEPVRENFINFDADEVNHTVREGWSLRQHQLPVREFILNGETKSKLISMATGTGKAQPFTSRIKTPTGWITMGEVYVGCEVSTPDGQSTYVNGVYPQGSQSIYEIEFIDRRRCEASSEHLWRIFDKDSIRYKTINTLKVKNHTDGIRKRYYVDLIKSSGNEDQPVPLDPYLLGALLGDGGFTGVSVKFTNTSAEMVENVKSRVPSTHEMVTQDGVRWSIVNKIKGKNNESLWSIFEQLGLRGLYSHEKFIPKVYLEGSHAQRLLLMQGLIDTDGHVSVDGTLGYSTSSGQLAKDFEYLAQSLGCVVKVRELTPFYTYKGEKLKGKNSYLFTIRHVDPLSLLTFSSKRNRLIGNCTRSPNLKLRVESVKYLREDKVQCISLDSSDGLYITDNFITTHNTSTSLISLSDTKYKIGIVVLSRFAEKWLFDIANIYNVHVDEIMVVQGAKSLKVLIAQSKDGQRKSNYVIFSAETLQSFLSSYEEDQELCVQTFGCSPIDLFPTLGLGSLLMDEAHMSFHSLYKIVIHTNAKFHLALSATFTSDDNVVKRAQSVMFPPKTIYDTGEFDKYTDVYALAYSIPPDYLRKVKTTNYGSNSYSHTAFEQSVMKLPPLLNLFNSLVDNTLNDFYIERYEPKDKCLIFVSTVKMATHLSERYTRMYPDKVVYRYCEEDPFENILEGEIVVTTVISAGTAIDIPDLRVVIQTVSISSSVANIQTLGRLRKLKDNKDTRFCYVYAENLQKQRQYHHRRLDLYKDRALSHQNFRARVAHF